jgi:hypothetical protein
MASKSKRPGGNRAFMQVAAQLHRNHSVQHKCESSRRFSAAQEVKFLVAQFGDFHEHS